jgi:hypothetical protein
MVFAPSPENRIDVISIEESVMETIRRMVRSLCCLGVFIVAGLSCPSAPAGSPWDTSLLRKVQLPFIRSDAGEYDFHLAAAYETMRERDKAHP